MTISLERVAFDDVPWLDLDALADRTIWQTRDWLRFLERSQGARPVVAAVHDGRRLVGWFTGARVRRLGLPVLGSPLRGWSTSYMGFNLVDHNADRAALAPALASFAWKTLRCAHLEVMDRWTTEVPRGWSTTVLPGWELDLAPEPEALLARTSASCRANIRRAARQVTVDRADASTFAPLYHQHLREVFEYRGLRVPFHQGRVQDLITSIDEQRRLLLVARTDDGRPVATGIFVGTPQRAFLWGQASTIADRKLYPNEAILWNAILTWRERGTRYVDFGGGGGRFKAKFGGTPISVPWMRWSKVAGLETARRAVVAVHQRRRSIRHGW